MIGENLAKATDACTSGGQRKVEDVVLALHRGMKVCERCRYMYHSME